MKYFYISCLLLSSFFTYKTLSAKDNYLEYAFFIPQGAFEQDTPLEDIESMRPRQPKPIVQDPDDIQSEEEPTPLKITLPYVKKKLEVKKEITTNTTRQPTQKTSATNKTITQKKTEQTVTEKTPNLSPNIIEKLNKYSLETNTQEKTEEKPAQKTASQTPEELPKKTLSEMLSSVPYPNPSLPRFKQLYASYVMDLRIFNRRGKLPVNPRQERILKKADSIRRFEVK